MWQTEKIISLGRVPTVTFPGGRLLHLAGPIIRGRLLNAFLGIFIWLPVLVFTIVIFIELPLQRHVGASRLRAKVKYEPLCQIYFIALCSTHFFGFHIFLLHEKYFS